MEQNLSTIGARLRKAREAKNFTMDTIHELTGLHKSNLSGHEKNKSKPSANALIALSDLYGVSTDWILKGENPSLARIMEDRALYGAEYPGVPNKELTGLIHVVLEAWEKGDEATRGWILVQLRRAFPEMVERGRGE